MRIKKKKHEFYRKKINTYIYKKRLLNIYIYIRFLEKLREKKN